MNILVVNPIVYTSETKRILRAESIIDTMIYDLCLAFKEMGHNVTLFAAEPYKPTREEKYPFPVIWGKCAMKAVCMPHCLPFMPELVRFVLKNTKQIDLIISSEVFSLNSLCVALIARKKLIIWHELAKHNAMFREVPSRFWYNIVARLLMRNACVVARSEAAKLFVRQFCKNTRDYVIDHGVNLKKFRESAEKQDYFIVCSQLISRKRIEGILFKYQKYLQETGNKTGLYIIGEGVLRAKIEELSCKLGIEEKVMFMGKMDHVQLVPYLSRAKALLVNTEKDNNMISIVEAIAVGTPIVTTNVPLNAAYIKKYELGIVGDWSAMDLKKVVDDNARYVANCLNYRKVLSTENKAEQFIHVLDKPN